MPEEKKKEVKSMNKTKLSISTYSMAAVILILGVIDKLLDSNTVSAFAGLVNPILVIATVICAYLCFNEVTSLRSKWVWVYLSMGFINVLYNIAAIPLIIFEEAKIIIVMEQLLSAIGLCLVFISVLHEKLSRNMAFGFCVLAVDQIFVLFLYGFNLVSLLSAIAYVGFALIAFNFLPSLNKIIRWVIVILAAITAASDPFFGIRLIILAFLLVPAQKTKLNFSKIVAILCIVTAVFTVITVINSNPFGALEEYNYDVEQKKQLVDEYKDYIKELEQDEYADEDDIEWYRDNLDYAKEQLASFRDARNAVIFRIIVVIIAVALALGFLVCQAICLFKSKFDKLAYLSYALMAASALLLSLYSTYRFAFWSFDLLEYPIYSFLTTSHFWTIAAAITFAVLLHRQGVKVKRFRVLAIVFAVLMLLTAFLDTTLYYYGGELHSVVYALFALTVICISLVMAPLSFTEYNNVAKHIFFTVITLGIWMLIWIYHVTKNLSKDGARKPWTELLLCMFVPFYYIYWIYKTAEHTEKYGAENGKTFQISILCLAIAIVSPLISTIVIQDKINQIVGKPE